MSINKINSFKEDSKLHGKIKNSIGAMILGCSSLVANANANFDNNYNEIEEVSKICTEENIKNAEKYELNKEKTYLYKNRFLTLNEFLRFCNGFHGEYGTNDINQIREIERKINISLKYLGEENFNLIMRDNNISSRIDFFKFTENMQKFAKEKLKGYENIEIDGIFGEHTFKAYITMIENYNRKYNNEVKYSQNELKTDENIDHKKELAKFMNLVEQYKNILKKENKNNSNKNAEYELKNIIRDITLLNINKNLNELTPEELNLIKSKVKEFQEKYNNLELLYHYPILSNREEAERIYPKANLVLDGLPGEETRKALIFLKIFQKTYNDFFNYQRFRNIGFLDNNTKIALENITKISLEDIAKYDNFYKSLSNNLKRENNDEGVITIITYYNETY